VNLAAVPSGSGGWSAAATGDFNGDGKSDILWRNNASGVVEEWLMNGSTVSSMPNIATVDPSSGWVIRGAADFNGDGKSDILWQNTGSGALQEWAMNGSSVTSIINLSTIAPATGWSLEGAGDFNGDGNSDLLWQNSNTGQVELWFMDGAGNVSSTPDIATVSPASGWDIEGTGDLNGDGRSDILWRNTSSGVVQAWFMNGTSFSSANIGSAPSNWLALAGGG
jgi:hypothetical protein